MDYNILSHKDENEYSIKDLSPDFLNLGVRRGNYEAGSLSSVTFTLFLYHFLLFGSKFCLSSSFMLPPQKSVSCVLRTLIQAACTPPINIAEA